MNNENQQHDYQRKNNVSGVLMGVLVGGLAGAVTALLLAPQSGEDTRTQLKEKGIELRDRTTGLVKEVVERVSSDKDRLTSQGREKAKELLHQGQEIVADQLDRVSDAAQAGKKAIQGSSSKNS